MSGAERREVWRRAAAEARDLVRGALFELQEDALGRPDGTERARLLWVAEQLADGMSLLFEIERDADADIESLRHARRTLNEVLESLRLSAFEGTNARRAAGPVGRALAVVHAAMGQEPDEPDDGVVEATTLARSSRKGLVLVDSGDAWADAAAEALEQASRAPAGERRANERVTLAVDVGFVSESNFYAGLSMDVSAGGLFVATYQKLAVGTEVTLSFVLPDGTPITTEGEVRWTRDPGNEDSKPGIGVAFKSLSERDLGAIQRFCQSRPPMYVEVAGEE